MLRVRFEIDGKKFGLWAGTTVSDPGSVASKTQRIDEILKATSAFLEKRGLKCDAQMSYAIMSEEAEGQLLIRKLIRKG